MNTSDMTAPMARQVGPVATGNGLASPLARQAVARSASRFPTVCARARHAHLPLSGTGGMVNGQIGARLMVGTRRARPSAESATIGRPDRDWGRSRAMRGPLAEVVAGDPAADYEARRNRS